MWKLLLTQSKAYQYSQHVFFSSFVHIHFTCFFHHPVDEAYKRHWYFPGACHWLFALNHKLNHFIKNCARYLFSSTKSLESNPNDPISISNGNAIEMGFFIKNFTIDLMASSNSLYNCIAHIIACSTMYFAMTWNYYSYIYENYRHPEMPFLIPSLKHHTVDVDGFSIFWNSFLYTKTARAALFQNITFCANDSTI